MCTPSSTSTSVLSTPSDTNASGGTVILHPSSAPELDLLALEPHIYMCTSVLPLTNKVVPVSLITQPLNIAG